VVNTRRNLIDPPVETWRPAPIVDPGVVRRFMDLQLASIWKDLKPLLGGVSGSILDVGCGEQPYRWMLPDGVAYTGIDIPETEERFGNRHPDTVFVTGFDWPFAEGSFDVALCTEVLEHIEEPIVMLQSIRRVLRVGGTLIVTVPFAARWHFVPYDYWRYTPSGLVSLARHSGFEVVSINARGNPLTVAAQKIIGLVASLGRWGAPLLPFAGVAALVGQWSLRSDWGADPLGYTLVARAVG
jgi:SAM-dependent methyltransferase